MGIIEEYTQLHKGNSGQNGTEYKSGGQNRDLQRQSLLNVVGLA